MTLNSHSLEVNFSELNVLIIGRIALFLEKEKPKKEILISSIKCLSQFVANFESEMGYIPRL